MSPSLWSARRGISQWTDAESLFCASGLLVNRDDSAVDEHRLQVGMATEGLYNSLEQWCYSLAAVGLSWK